MSCTCRFSLCEEIELFVSAGHVNGSQTPTPPRPPITIRARCSPTARSNAGATTYSPKVVGRRRYSPQPPDVRICASGDTARPGRAFEASDGCLRIHRGSVATASATVGYRSARRRWHVNPCRSRRRRVALGRAYCVPRTEAKMGQQGVDHDYVRLGKNWPPSWENTH
jgi:hypothetical protein